jgi:hypothetical protein
MSFESFLMKDGVQEFFKQLNRPWCHATLVGLLTFVGLRLIPKTWNDASNRFEGKYKKILLALATIAILWSVGFLVYFLVVISSRDYPTAR